MGQGGLQQRVADPGPAKSRVETRSRGDESGEESSENRI